MNDFERVKSIAEYARKAFDKLDAGRSAHFEFHEINKISSDVCVQKRMEFYKNLKKYVSLTITVICYATSATMALWLVGCLMEGLFHLLPLVIATGCISALIGAVVIAYYNSI